MRHSAFNIHMLKTPVKTQPQRCHASITAEARGWPRSHTKRNRWVSCSQEKPRRNSSQWPYFLLSYHSTTSNSYDVAPPAALRPSIHLVANVVVTYRSCRLQRPLNAFRLSPDSGDGCWYTAPPIYRRPCHQLCTLTVVYIPHDAGRAARPCSPYADTSDVTQFHDVW